MTLSRDDFMKLRSMVKTDMYDVCCKTRILGMVLEFGVWKAGSINYIADRCKDTTVYGFDSFEGLPEKWEISDTNVREVGAFATTLPQVRANVSLVKGYFQDTVPGFLAQNPGHVSLLHIDSDLYSSAKYVLEALDNRIKKGTIIIFDELCDWSEDQHWYPKWREGEWKAMQEWLAARKRRILPLARNQDMRAAVTVTK